MERTIVRQRAVREAEEHDRREMKSRLHVWDDDESDELFYIDRAKWRSQRSRRLVVEEAPYSLKGPRLPRGGCPKRFGKQR